MRKIYTPILRYLVVLLLSLGFFEGNATNYTVDRAGGDRTNGAGNVGSFIYVLNLVRGTTGPHTINFTYTGVIQHTNDLDDWLDPWTLTVNNTNAATAANMVTITGNGATISWAGYNAPLNASYGVNALTLMGNYITINNLNFTAGSNGTAPYTGKGAGVLIADASDGGVAGLTAYHDITFNSCNFTANGGPGVYNSIYSSSTSLGVKNISLSSCNSTGNGQAGIQFSQADNVKILNTNASSNKQEGVLFTGYNTVAGIGYYSDQVANVITIFKGVTNSTVDGCTINNNGISGTGSGLKLVGNCDNNTITKNTVNANIEHGILLSISSSSNKVTNNTASFNTGSTLNCGIMISLGGNSNNIIKSNTVEGNKNYGIYLYDNYGIPNVNNLIEGNTVIKNVSHGIYVLNSSATVVRSNLVGTDVSLTDKNNGGDGILFANNSSNGELSGNVVLFNKGNGINITAGVLINKTANPNENDILKAGSNNNYVFDNYLGIDKAGTTMGNVMNGLQISESFGTVVGRSPLAFSAIVASSATIYTANTLYKNYISGNKINGIILNNIDPNDGTINPPGSPGVTLIEGNFIGTNLTGLTSAANLGDGINAVKSSRITILNNTISGNTGDGVQFGNSQSSLSADMITLQGNIIGLKTDKSGILANGGHGVYLDQTSNVSIGDNTASAFSAKSNIIAGNGLNGIEISTLAASINVYYNRIGTNATGTAAFPNTIGISMTGANNNKIIGNLVSGNTSHGINVFTASGVTNPNTIAKNFIGTVELGTAALANGGNGINLDACNNNVIGGTSLVDGNLVSGNTGDGIALTNNSDANKIDGNTIGLNLSGSGIIPNGKNGINLTAGASNNSIGTVFKNYISGNTDNGIVLTSASTNTIAKNVIGFGLNGSTIYSNGKDGISLTGSTSNIIGGPLATDGNIVSGNTLNGISLLAASNSNTLSNNLVGTTSAGTGAPAGAKQVIGILINASNGNTLNVNTVGNSSSHGISLIGAGTLALPNVIKANNVGLGNSATGTVPNGGNGIDLSNSAYNTIGGTLALDKNIVAGNTGIGINLSALSNHNTIQNNYVGTNGATKFANSNGIVLASANSNTILANIVSGNTADGIKLTLSGSTGPLLTGNGNTINGNTIGFSATGVAMANGGNGISLSQSSFNTIGASGFANVIGNNGKDGIALVKTSASNSIAYNTVGVNAAMTTAAANDNGITITESNSNALSNNTISGNTNDGLVLDNASFSVVTGNNVGTNAAAANLGNGAIGMSLKTGSASNIISSGNVVANNQQAIVVDGATTIQNKISQNSVYCNLTADLVPGIDLRSNGNINFLNPLLPTQQPGLDTLGKALVMGGLTATVGSTVEVFLKDAGCTNCQQGKTYIGSTTIVAASPFVGDPLQGFVYNFAPATSLKKANCNDYVVTVTDLNGNTSQFSTCSDCINGCVPSTITAHPQNNLNVCESKTGVTFSGTSSGATDKYSWEIRKKGGLQFDSIIDIATYTGLTTNTLGIKNGVTLAMNGDTLRMKVYTCGSFIYSNIAILTVDTIPTFTYGPNPKTVCVGANHTFTSLATGTNVTYKWQKSINNGASFSDITPAETNANLALTGIPFGSNKYQYQVVVSGKCPPASTLALKAILTVDTATTIRTAPSTSTVCLGKDASFSVVADGRLDTNGVSDITYQWQVDSTGTYQDIVGETSTSLTVPTKATVIGMNNFKYRAIAYGTCDSAASSAAQIVFTTSPLTKISPTFSPTCEGKNITLTGKIDFASSYQWKVSTNSGATWSDVVADLNYKNVTSTTLKIDSLPYAFDTYTYRLIGIGACAPNDSTVDVVVNVLQKPVVTTEPVLSNKCEGEATSFDIVAKGESLTYQWKVSTNNGLSYSNIASLAPHTVTDAATTSKLDINPIDSAMNQNLYAVYVGGTCGKDTSKAVLLTVNTKAKISAPVNASVCENDKTILVVAAKGTGVSVQWEKYDGVSAYVPLTNVSPYSGVTNDTLTITNPSNTLSGAKYRAVASTTGLCVTSVPSSDAVLTVDTIPTVSNPSDVTICELTPTSFTATATGTATTYQWQASYNAGVSYVNIGNGGVYSGTTTNTLNVLSPTYSMNNYLYRVMIDGKCKTGVPSLSAKLTVDQKPAITKQPIMDTVCENLPATFKVTASGTSLVFNWEKSTDGGLLWSPVAATASTSTTSTLTIASVSMAMANDLYRAIITNTSACSTATAVVSNAVGFALTSAPAITQEPFNVTICEGATASFNVVATPADGTLTFDWKVKKSSDVGFTSVTVDPLNPQVLDITTDATYDNAQVQVIVTGACGLPLPSRSATIQFIIPNLSIKDNSRICNGITNASLEITFPDATTSASWTVNIPTGVSVSGGVGNNLNGVNGLIQSINENYTNTGNDANVTYIITPRSVTGCLGVPQSASIVLLSPSQPSINGASDICPGMSHTFTTQQFKLGTYAWYKNSDPVPLVGETSNQLTVVMGKEQDEYVVVFTDTCGNAYDADTLLIPIDPVDVYFDVPTKVCSDFPATFDSHIISTNKLVDKYVWNFGFGTTTSILDSSTTSASYAYGDAGVYKVKLEAYFKGCLIGDTIAPVTIQDCSIVVPNIFTPNGDGANDGWVIENIEYYPSASVSIFNRWGVIVWTATNGYVQQWDGRNSEKQVLEDGTYYYVIDLKSGDKKARIKRGYITVLTDNK